MADITGFETVKRLLDSASSSGLGSPSTRKTYLFFLEKYIKFTGKTPDELIEERLKQLGSSNLMDRKAHEELLTGFQNYLELTCRQCGTAIPADTIKCPKCGKEKYSRGSIITAHNAVRAFYNSNYVTLIIKAPKYWTTSERADIAPTPEEVSDAVKTCREIRDKTIIVFLGQSGISLEDFCELVTFDKVKKQLEAGIEPIHLLMERQKIKKKYDTFIGKDAIKLLKEYISTVSLRSQDPIFLNEETGSAFTPRTIENIVTNATTRAGMKIPLSPHNLRKFFSTYMSMSFHTFHSGHIPIVDYWMGHKLPYKGTYMIPPVEDPPVNVAAKKDQQPIGQRTLYRTHEWAIAVKI